MRKIYFFTLITFVCLIYDLQHRINSLPLAVAVVLRAQRLYIRLHLRGKSLRVLASVTWNSLCVEKSRKTKAKQIVKRVADQVTETSFDHPGNLFYFISYTEDNNVRTFKWGDADHPVQEDVKKLYDEVLASVNGIRFKPIN